MALLKDKIAIVTGASSGIRRAIALKFAAEGTAVVIADTVETPIEGGETTVDLIRSAGGTTGIYVETDVSDWNAVDALVAATVARFYSHRRPGHGSGIRTTWRARRCSLPAIWPATSPASFDGRRRLDGRLSAGRAATICCVLHLIRRCR